MNTKMLTTGLETPHYSYLKYHSGSYSRQRDDGCAVYLEPELDVGEARVANKTMHVLVQSHRLHHDCRLGSRLVDERVRPDALPNNLDVHFHKVFFLTEHNER